MDTQLEIKKLLLGEIDRLKARNPSYSLRAFAQRLGLAPSAVSEILNGKREISKKMAAKVLERLCVSPDRQTEFLQGFAEEREIEAQELVQINMDHYHLISDWYYFAILSLSETENFRGEPGWVAISLNIKLSEAKTALERLERLELLKRNKSGKLIWSGLHFKTTSDVVNLSLRKSHSQNLELARISLDKDSIDERDFSAMTMAIDPAKLPEAKKRIQKFRRSLAAFLESGEKTQVYKICLQLFPLSRRTK